MKELSEDFFLLQISKIALIITLCPLIRLLFLLYLIYGFFNQYFAFFMIVLIRDSEMLYCAGNVGNIWLTIFPLWEENKAIKITFCFKNKMHRVKECPCLRASFYWSFVWRSSHLRRPSLTDSHCQCSYIDNRATGLRGDQCNTRSDCHLCRTFLFKTSVIVVLVLLSLPKACTESNKPNKKGEKWSLSFRLHSLARISFLVWAEGREKLAVVLSLWWKRKMKGFGMKLNET